MRAPLSWIREFTPVEAPPAEIADALNQLGLEVEGIDEPGREIGGVVVARILEVMPHPDADRIRLADVDATEFLQRGLCGRTLMQMARRRKRNFATVLYL
jgi:phenylalanyl-tRNA synthetase beta chain